MTTFKTAALFLCALTFSAALLADDAFERARRQSAISGRPVLVFTHAKDPRQRIDVPAQFLAAIRTDKETAERAALFEIAFVDLYDPSQQDRVNVEKFVRFGAKSTASVYLRGSDRRAWRATFLDEGKPREKFERDHVYQVFRLAEVGYTSYAGLEGIENTVANQPTELEPRLELARAYGVAHQWEKARKELLLAHNFVRARNTRDARIEDAYLQLAEAAYHAGVYDEARADYETFMAKFPFSTRKGYARVMAARAQALHGDTVGAALRLRVILAESGAREYHSEAEAALRDLNLE